MIRMGQPAAASNSSTATPAMIAQSITGRPYLSWSQTQQYQMYPRAFEFKYVLKAAPAFVPSSLGHKLWPGTFLTEDRRRSLTRLAKNILRVELYKLTHRLHFFHFRS